MVLQDLLYQQQLLLQIHRHLKKKEKDGFFFLKIIFLQIPKSAPNAKPTSPPLELPTAAIAENMSGAPLPKARKVTPYSKKYFLSNLRFY